MQQLIRQMIMAAAILTVLVALDQTWNQEFPEPAAEATAEAKSEQPTTWRYTKYGWQDKIGRAHV